MINKVQFQTSGNHTFKAVVDGQIREYNNTTKENFHKSIEVLKKNGNNVGNTWKSNGGVKPTAKQTVGASIDMLNAKLNSQRGLGKGDKILLNSLNNGRGVPKENILKQLFINLTGGRREVVIDQSAKQKFEGIHDEKIAYQTKIKDAKQKRELLIKAEQAHGEGLLGQLSNEMKVNPDMGNFTYNSETVSLPASKTIINKEIKAYESAKKNREEAEKKLQELKDEANIRPNARAAYQPQIEKQETILQARTKKEEEHKNRIFAELRAANNDDFSKSLTSHQKGIIESENTITANEDYLDAVKQANNQFLGKISKETSAQTSTQTSNPAQTSITQQQATATTNNSAQASTSSTASEKTSKEEADRFNRFLGTHSESLDNCTVEINGQEHLIKDIKPENLTQEELESVRKQAAGQIGFWKGLTNGVRETRKWDSEIGQFTDQISWGAVAARALTGVGLVAVVGNIWNSIFGNKTNNN